jgi:hypothetical protein
MSHLITNTAAPSANSLHGATNWDSQSLELFATKKQSIQCGSRSKTILSPSGDLETEASGEGGYEITATSYHDRGWE